MNNLDSDLMDSQKSSDPCLSNFGQIGSAISGVNSTATNNGANHSLPNPTMESGSGFSLSNESTLFRSQENDDYMMPSLLREPLLTDDIANTHYPASPLSSPDAATPHRVSSPIYFDNNTQNTLCERSQAIKLEDNTMDTIDQESAHVLSIMSGTKHVPTSPPDFRNTQQEPSPTAANFKFDGIPSNILGPTVNATGNMNQAEPPNMAVANDDSTQWGLLDTNSTSTGLLTKDADVINALPSFSNFVPEVSKDKHGESSGRLIKQEVTTSISPTEANSEPTSVLLTDEVASNGMIGISGQHRSSISKRDKLSKSSKLAEGEASSGNTGSSHVRPMALSRASREATLHHSFPAQSMGYELKVLVQPENQHRARYQTEGSRGAIKDQSQQSFPRVQLIGFDKHPLDLQIFIGSDTGKIRPHGFYQACKVSGIGKNSTKCVEKDIDGTTVIEVQMRPEDEMTSVIDCVGILKLRNSDVEARIGMAKSKKKSTHARMVFRVNVPCHATGRMVTLQTSSISISCTQPAGQPEICKMSLSECIVKGGEELFIIGKNFAKGCKAVFQELMDDKVVWRAESAIDTEYFHASHMICTVPPYKTMDVTESTPVQLVIACSSRTSEAFKFTYLPLPSSKRQYSELESADESEICRIVHTSSDAMLEEDIEPPTKTVVYETETGESGDDTDDREKCKSQEASTIEMSDMRNADLYSVPEEQPFINPNNKEQSIAITATLPLQQTQAMGILNGQPSATPPTPINNTIIIKPNDNIADASAILAPTLGRSSSAASPLVPSGIATPPADVASPPCGLVSPPSGVVSPPSGIIVQNNVVQNNGELKTASSQFMQGSTNNILPVLNSNGQTIHILTTQLQNKLLTNQQTERSVVKMDTDPLPNKATSLPLSNAAPIIPHAIDQQINFKLPVVSNMSSDNPLAATITSDASHQQPQMISSNPSHTTIVSPPKGLASAPNGSEESKPLSFVQAANLMPVINTAGQTLHVLTGNALEPFQQQQQPQQTSQAQPNQAFLQPQQIAPCQPSEPVSMETEPVHSTTSTSKPPISVTTSLSDTEQMSLALQAIKSQLAAFHATQQQQNSGQGSGGISSVSPVQAMDTTPSNPSTVSSVTFPSNTHTVTTSATTDAGTANVTAPVSNKPEITLLSNLLLANASTGKSLTDASTILQVLADSQKKVQQQSTLEQQFQQQLQQQNQLRQQQMHQQQQQQSHQQQVINLALASNFKPEASRSGFFLTAGQAIQQIKVEGEPATSTESVVGTPMEIQYATHTSVETTQQTTPAPSFAKVAFKPATTTVIRPDIEARPAVTPTAVVQPSVFTTNLQPLQPKGSDQQTSSQSITAVNAETNNVLLNPPSVPSLPMVSLYQPSATTSAPAQLLQCVNIPAGAQPSSSNTNTATPINIPVIIIQTTQASSINTALLANATPHTLPSVINTGQQMSIHSQQPTPLQPTMIPASMMVNQLGTSSTPGLLQNATVGLMQQLSMTAPVISQCSGTGSMTQPSVTNVVKSTPTAIPHTGMQGSDGQLYSITSSGLSEHMMSNASSSVAAAQPTQQPTVPHQQYVVAVSQPNQNPQQIVTSPDKQQQQASLIASLAGQISALGGMESASQLEETLKKVLSRPASLQPPKHAQQDEQPRTVNHPQQLGQPPTLQLSQAQIQQVGQTAQVQQIGQTVQGQQVVQPAQVPQLVQPTQVQQINQVAQMQQMTQPTGAPSVQVQQMLQPTHVGVSVSEGSQMLVSPTNDAAATQTLASGAASHTSSVGSPTLPTDNVAVNADSAVGGIVRNHSDPIMEQQNSPQQQQQQPVQMSASSPPTPQQVDSPSTRHPIMTPTSPQDPSTPTNQTPNTPTSPTPGTAGSTPAPQQNTNASQQQQPPSETPAAPTNSSTQQTHLPNIPVEDVDRLLT